MNVVAIGGRDRVIGFGLAGARVVEADTPDAVLAAWDDLDDDAQLLVLTPSAAEVLSPRLHERPRVLEVVLP